MGGGRRFPGALVRPLLAAGTVFAMLAAVGCGADIDVDHADAPQVKPLEGEAPAPGRFERAWRTKVQADRAYFVDGALVVRTGNVLRGYDARTGKATWHYREREPGWSLSGIAITDGVLVLNTGRENEEGMITDRHTVGLDAATGEILWQNQNYWYLAYDDSGISGTSEPGVAAHGTVVIQPDKDSERLGIDARTGDVRWRVSEGDLSKGQCDLEDGEPAPKDDRTRIIGVRLTCEEPDPPAPTSEVFAAVDAVSGELRWSRSVPDAQSTTMMRGGYTLLQETRESPPIVLGPTGKRLYSPGSGSCSPSSICTLKVTGGRVVLTYDGDDATETQRAVIDPGTGKARVGAADLSRLPDRVAAADGRLYGKGILMSRDGSNLLPQALRIYDVRSGADRQLPLPADSGVLTTRSPNEVRVLGAAGDRVIAQSWGRTEGTMTLTAYERTGGMPEPVELGGVDPEDWPDPCGLLDGLPVRTLSGYDEDDEDDGAEPRQPEGDALRVGRATVPHTTCSLDVPGTSPVTVSVVWVASSEKTAAAMLPGRQSQLENVDEAYLQDIGYGQSSLVRIGRTVVQVEATDVDIVSETVAKNLR